MGYLIVYHRGGGKSLDYPPNCIFTIKWALSHKAKAIEFDVVVASEEQYHRMVVIEPKLITQNNLSIDNLQWRDIIKLDAGNKKSGPCKIATLCEILDMAHIKQTKLQIHMKGQNPHTVSTLISELKFKKNIILTSFDLEVLVEVKRIEPRLRVGWIVKPDSESGSEGSTDLTKEVASNTKNLPAYDNYELDGILNEASAKHIDVVILCAPKIRKKGIVERFRKEGFEIGAWGIGTNLSLARKLIAFGIDRFTLDNPEEFSVFPKLP